MASNNFDGTNTQDEGMGSSPAKKKKRTLPSWMSQAKKENKCVDEHQKNGDVSVQTKPKLGGLKLPELEFRGTVFYSYLRDDCSLLCADILDRLQDGADFPVGLDLEWPVTYQQGREPKTALLQLCASHSECYLFHLSCMGGFPAGLKRLLGHPRVIKTGIGIEGDLWKLERDFEIKAKPMIEGSTVELGPLACKILKTTGSWSLDGLSQHLLHHQLNKDPLIRKSDWSNYPLSDCQKKYAATDAYASLRVYEELMKRQDIKQ